MMRENDRDGEDGWAQPPGYVSPWAPHDEGEAGRTRWPGANATPPPESSYQDTIAFGSHADPHRSMRSAAWRGVRRVPREYPVLALGVKTHLFPVTNRTPRHRQV